MTLEFERLSNRNPTPEVTDQGTPAAKNGSLVINLCKVGTPITIPQPRSPQLTRFSFFLSQSWQGSRRIYRLQMGYFSTHVEADGWLKTLRSIYPGAFVSDVSAAQTEPLSDTQVSRILEQRGAEFATSAARQRPGRTLEETLAILGTSEFDMGSKDRIDGMGAQDLRIELQKESPYWRRFRRPRLRTRKP